MANRGEYAKCKWCGKTFEKGILNKFLAFNTMGLAGKESYCSTKCESEAQGNSGGGGGGGGNNSG